MPGSPMVSMEMAMVKKWAVFFAVILAAILIADALSTIILSFLGLEGPARFIINFVLYALIFFAILYGIEKYLNIDIFRISRD
jgi:amino acid transporter